MISDLLKIFSNYTRSLEVLYLLNDIRKAVRLDANKFEIWRIRDFCRKNNLQIDVSDFKVVKVLDKGKGGYANRAERVSQSFPGDGLYHVYLSKDKNKTKMLKLLEGKNDDRAVGELLGYPECCVDFFVENNELQQKMQNDYILPALKNSDGFKFPFYTNCAVRYFDVTLLSHFPHDFNCGKSIKIGRKNLDLIRKFSGELAARFEDKLKGPVLYTEREGIFIFEHFELGGNILKYGDVLSTTHNYLFNSLRDIKKIIIRSKSNVEIGDRTLKDVGFMVFI